VKISFEPTNTLEGDHLLAVRPKRTGPSIMHIGAQEVGQDPNLIQGFLPSIGMDLLVRQVARRGHMRPPTRSHDVQPCVVLVDDFFLAQSRFDLSLNWLALLSRPLQVRGERSLAYLHPQQIAEDFCGATSQQELLGHHRDRHAS
jgi:hypothetical protein